MLNIWKWTIVLNKNSFGRNQNEYIIHMYSCKNLLKEVFHEQEDIHVLPPLAFCRIISKVLCLNYPQKQSRIKYICVAFKYSWNALHALSLYEH